MVCGRCWAAHGGKPAAWEIGPEPVETAPLRYPSGQRHWLSALRRADWVQDTRVDGRQNLLDIAKCLARHADWTTVESWPGWDTLVARSGTSETTVQRWLQELRVRGWLVVVETGSTPQTRPMALTLPNGRVLSRDEGNRRAVYALRIPLSPDEALRWAAEALAAQAAQEAARAATEQRQRLVAKVRGLLAKAASTGYDCERQALAAKANELIAEHGLTPAELTDPDVDAAEQHRKEDREFDRVMSDPELRQLYLDFVQRPQRAQETRSEQGESASLGEEKGWPTWSFGFSQKTWVGGYARAGAVVDDLGMPVADPWRGNDQMSALRARSDHEEQADFAVMVPASRFEMLVCADWLRRTLPIFGRLTRKAVRAACLPFWRSGWSNLDIVHAMDHLPSAFGLRAGTPIGRGPADGMDSAGAWWWITTRLDAWRDAGGQVRRGYFQTRGRRKAMRQAVAERYGRAALSVLRDEDLAVDPILTPDKVAEFGRRVAEQLRPARDPRPASTSPPVGTPTASPHTRAAARAELEAADATKARRRAQHAAVMDRYADHIAQARAELAKRTAPDPAAFVDPALLAETDSLTPDERHELARQRARLGNNGHGCGPRQRQRRR